MEFHEKLAELRKSKGLTQEELAEALFVSRTAISKWESGRGYPSIDSLKVISRFFAVTIDELICPREMITAAENDKKETLSGYISVICYTLDILTAVLFFLPVFGNGADSPASAALFGLTGIQPWLKAVFIAVIGISAMIGISGVVLSHPDQPARNRRLTITGMALSVTAVGIFIAARQPYAGIICFSFLVIKAWLMAKGNKDLKGNCENENK